MKILVLSDIHANYEALLSLDKYVQECDTVLSLGDITGYSCAVNECIEYARTHNFVSIQGNHDRYVIEGMYSQTKFLNESSNSLNWRLLLKYDAKSSLLNSNST